MIKRLSPVQLQAAGEACSDCRHRLRRQSPQSHLKYAAPDLEVCEKVKGKDLNRENMLPRKKKSLEMKFITEYNEIFKTAVFQPRVLDFSPSDYLTVYSQIQRSPLRFL